MPVNEGLIFDATVTLVGGKKYSRDILNYKRGGFAIRVASNQGSGDIEADLSLESWDDDNGWIPEVLAVFPNPPNGSARKSVDTFRDTQSAKYRVGIDPTGGTSGPVVIVYSMQTEE